MDAIELVEILRNGANSDVARLNTEATTNLLDYLMLQGIQTRYTDLYALLINLYHRQNQATEALTIFERGRSRLFLDMMATGRTQLPEQDAQSLTDVQKAFLVWQQTEEVVTQITLAEEVGLAERSAVQRLELDRDRARDNYETLLNSLRTSHPQIAALAPGGDTMLSLADIQTQILDDTTTLILFYINDGPIFPDQTLAWVIDRRKIKLIDLDVPVDALRNDVKLFRQSMEAAKNSTNKNDLAEVEAILERLYTTLFAPLIPHI